MKVSVTVSNAEHYEGESSASAMTAYAGGVLTSWLSGSLGGGSSSSESSTSTEITADSTVTVMVSGGDTTGIGNGAMNSQNWNAPEVAAVGKALAWHPLLSRCHDLGSHLGDG